MEHPLVRTTERFLIEHLKIVQSSHINCQNEMRKKDGNHININSSKSTPSVATKQCNGTTVDLQLPSYILMISLSGGEYSDNQP